MIMSKAGSVTGAFDGGRVETGWAGKASIRLQGSRIYWLPPSEQLEGDESSESLG